MNLFARLLTAATVLCSVALAQELNSLQPQGYVSDFANVVDAASKQRIELYCARLQKATGAQIAVVTLPSVNGEPLEEVANDLFRRWGIGQKGEDNGLLFLLVINDHLSRIEVGRGLEPYITDGRSGTTLRQMRPALRDGQYGEALQIAVSSLGQVIADAKGVQVDLGPARMQRPPPPQPVYDGVPWPVLIGGLFLLMMLMGRGGPRGGGRGRYGGGGGGFLPGLILGNVLGGLGGRSGYGGGYGGGGFGGYDSGDTFGGFGGGDSGGGGASSGW